MTGLIRKVANALRARTTQWSCRLYLRPHCRCCVCGTPLRRFMPYRQGSRSLPSFIRTLTIVGSDVENFSCPCCGAHDRERHLFLYFKEAGLLPKLAAASVLHFAPEKHLSRLVGQQGPARYVKADLYPTSADVTQLDMLRMHFAEGVFDFVIANHVLEHVADDRKALAEIHRVLKPGGFAVLQTPYTPTLHRTFEDAGLNSDAQRLEAYGQEDHVRLYGRDIFDRFSAAGFRSLVRSHSELLPHVDARHYGVNPGEPLFLFERQ